MSGRPRRQEAKPEPDSVSEPLAGTSSAHTLISDFRPPALWQNKVFVWSRPVSGTLSQQPWEADTHPHIRLLRALSSAFTTLTGCCVNLRVFCDEGKSSLRMRNMEEIASHSTGKGWKTETPSACLWGPLTPAHLPPDQRPCYMSLLGKDVHVSRNYRESRQGLNRDWTWRVTCWWLLLFVLRPSPSTVSACVMG